MNVLNVFTSYVVFAALSAFAGWIALQTHRLLIESAVFFTGSLRAAGAADKWGIFVLGIGWVIGVVILAERRRTAVEEGLLRRWVQRTVLVELAMFLVVYGMRWALG